AAAAIVRSAGIVIAPHIGGQRDIGLGVAADKIRAGAQVPEFGRAEDLRDLRTMVVLQAAVEQAVTALPPRRIVIAAPPIDALAAELVKPHQPAGGSKAVVYGKHAWADDGIEALK